MSNQICKICGHDKYIHSDSGEECFGFRPDAATHEQCDCRGFQPEEPAEPPTEREPWKLPLEQRLKHTAKIIEDWRKYIVVTEAKSISAELAVKLMGEVLNAVLENRPTQIYYCARCRILHLGLPCPKCNADKAASYEATKRELAWAADIIEPKKEAVHD